MSALLVSGASRREVTTLHQLAPGLQRPVDLTLGVAIDDRAPLVAPLLTPCERDLDLDPAVLEIETCGDDRLPLLAHLADEVGNLGALQEKLPVPGRVVVRDVALRVLGDLG